MHFGGKILESTLNQKEEKIPIILTLRDSILVCASVYSFVLQKQAYIWIFHLTF